MQPSPFPILIAFLTVGLCILAFIEFLRACMRLSRIVPRKESQRQQATPLPRILLLSFSWWRNPRPILHDDKLRRMCWHLFALALLLVVLTPAANRGFASLFDPSKGHAPELRWLQEERELAFSSGILDSRLMMAFTDLKMLLFPIVLLLTAMIASSAGAIQRERIFKILASHHGDVSRRHWLYFKLGYPYRFLTKSYAPALLEDTTFYPLHHRYMFLTRVFWFFMLLFFAALVSILVNIVL